MPLRANIGGGITGFYGLPIVRGGLSKVGNEESLCLVRSEQMLERAKLFGPY